MLNSANDVDRQKELMLRLKSLANEYDLSFAIVIEPGEANGITGGMISNLPIEGAQMLLERAMREVKLNVRAGKINNG